MARSIFALEVCAPMLGGQMHGELRALVQRHPYAATYEDKWNLYKRASEVLLANLTTLERGCWDFFDDDSRANRDFKMWCDGLFTEEGSRTEPSGIPDAYRGGEPRHLTFTIAIVLTQGTPTERMLAERCTIRQDLLWRRDTFAQIIALLPYVNFASVEGDVVYLIPRDDDWALTDQDLEHQKFEYLRTIV